MGAGVRRIGRQHSGGFRAINFERVSAGLALLSRGPNLVTGIGGELAGGSLDALGAGFSLHLDGYAFARRDAAGADAIVVVSIGYVFSPVAGTHWRLPHESAPPPAPPPAAPRDTPCDPTADRGALVAQRQRVVTACNAARDDAARTGECNRVNGRGSRRSLRASTRAPRTMRIDRTIVAIAIAIVAGGWVCQHSGDNPCPGALTCEIDVANVCCPFGSNT